MSRHLMFYDSEFTGLRQSTTLVSIALVDRGGKGFYAEFSDYDRSAVDSFIAGQVLANTRWLAGNTPVPVGGLSERDGEITSCVGGTAFVTTELSRFLQQWPAIEIWADHVSYDWVLFCELFGGALSLPESVHYIPGDLCTLLRTCGYDADRDRREFAGDFFQQHAEQGAEQHNALYDARVSLACFERVISEQGLAHLFGA